MAAVDPEDDIIRRFIAMHYRCDPERDERRHVVIAAFDDEREFKAFLNAQHAELRAKQAIGDAAKREHVSGVIHEPGARERQQNRRLLRRAVRHGAWPRGWDPLDPPEGISSVSAGGPDKPR